MNTKTKVIIAICAVFAVCSLVFYIVLGFFKPVVVQEVVYPGGNLSQSVFDSQNMKYVETQGLGVEHSFKSVPYTIDTADGVKAGIGNGAFYKKEPFYFYYSEASVNEATSDVLKREVTDILSLTAKEADTKIDVLKEESGYINGCTANYTVLRVAAGSGVSYMCLYRLHINEDLYASEGDLFVGVMGIGENVSSDSLQNLCTLANSSVYTMQYSKTLDEKLMKQKQEQQKDAEKNEKEEASNGDVSLDEGKTEEPVVSDNANDLFRTP